MLTIAAKPNALQAARLKKGYSLRELGGKAEVNYSTISKVERGIQKSVSPRVARQIYEALEGEFDDFFMLKNSEENEAS